MPVGFERVVERWIPWTAIASSAFPFSYLFHICGIFVSYFFGIWFVFVSSRLCSLELQFAARAFGFVSAVADQAAA